MEYRDNRIVYLNRSFLLKIGDDIIIVLVKKVDFDFWMCLFEIWVVI